jgi:hypothetical protein
MCLEQWTCRFVPFILYYDFFRVDIDIFDMPVVQCAVVEENEAKSSDRHPPLLCIERT